MLSARITESEEDWRQRQEAKEVLREAWDIMGPDPEVLLEYGLLLRKQLMRVDAKRVLNRAWAEARNKGSEFSPEQTARLHYHLGQIYETWWEDFQNLVMITESAARISCKAMQGRPAPHPDAAVICPESWATQLAGITSLADLKSDEREQMVEHFRMAVEADPDHIDANLRLLGHLADGEEWVEYMSVVRRLVDAAPANPRSHLFLGLALHEAGLDRAADIAFTEALALLTTAERRVFDNISPLLTEAGKARYAEMDSVDRSEAARIFFTSADPLYLNEAQERRLEHYARLAWAELKFGDPTQELRGWDTEKGNIWVRYGRPWRWYQCCYGGGGRDDYWSYGPKGPVFVFRGLLGYRHARLTSVAKQSADDLAVRAPQIYRPTTVTAVHELPHQMVRFRGSEPSFTLVEIYAAPPLDSLAATPGTSLDAGVFLFDAAYRPMWENRHPARVGESVVGLTYTFELPVGEYRYGVEARLRGPESAARPLARVRERLAIPGFPVDTLAVSDLMLADAIRPLDPNPMTREELRIWPSRTLRFVSGRPINLYFETYGLFTDADDLARYRVELAVEDAEQNNLVQRIFRGVVELFSGGDDQEPRVSWERVVPVFKGVAVDYVKVEVPALDVGEYLVRVTVTDMISGETAAAERKFRVDPL